MIPFNKPYMTGKEMHYIYDAVYSGKISGDGKYTKKCQEYFQNKYNFKKCLLTTSCTDALEMSAILLNIKENDEIIMPSFTFVSTANAFVLRGAKIVFCDSRNDHPGMDENAIESLITKNTKAIVVVHYAGIACDMDLIMQIANKYNLYVVEDAAQAIDSFYYSNKNKKKYALGSIGHLAALSFHETKNIISGEGGMLIINDEKMIDRAEIIWEKGTNRSSFYRGEINKYGWVDLGSSFLPSEIIAAFLWAQLENLEFIQNRRKEIWSFYNSNLVDWAKENNIILPYIPNYATNNAHMYYMIFKSLKERQYFIEELKQKKIFSVFHYQSLHESDFHIKKMKNKMIKLEHSEDYTEKLVRLPFYFEIDEHKVVDSVIQISL
jgi:dTDP-4-amino-4,6-dideoxygalactose transaminase